MYETTDKSGYTVKTKTILDVEDACSFLKL